jgi:hypothetical protein
MTLSGPWIVMVYAFLVSNLIWTAGLVAWTAAGIWGLLAAIRLIAHALTRTRHKISRLRTSRIVGDWP